MVPTSSRAGQRRSSSSAAWMHLLGQPLLVVAVEDGEAGLQADQLGMRPDHPHAHGMEGAEPHAGYAAPDQALDPLGHLAGGAVGEGDRQHLVRPGPAGDQDVGEPGGKHPGLAGAGAGQDQQRPVRRRHRGELLRIQALKIGASEPSRRHGGRRTSCNTHMLHGPGRGAAGIGTAALASGTGGGSPSAPGGW